MPGKILITALAVMLSCGTAEAISRYNSTRISCQKAHSLVRSQGAVIFRYKSKRNPTLTLYDRFVAHAGFCAFNETVWLKAIPTKTGPCELLFCRPRTDNRFWRY